MHGAAAGGSNVQPHAVIAQRQATRLIQHFKSRIMRRQSLHQTEPTIVFMLRVIQLGLKHQHAVINLADYINKPAVLADDHIARAAQAGYRIAINIVIALGNHIVNRQLAGGLINRKRCQRIAGQTGDIQTLAQHLAIYPPCPGHGRKSAQPGGRAAVKGNACLALQLTGAHGATRPGGTGLVKGRIGRQKVADRHTPGMAGAAVGYRNAITFSLTSTTLLREAVLVITRPLSGTSGSDEDVSSRSCLSPTFSTFSTRTRLALLSILPSAAGSTDAVMVKRMVPSAAINTSSYKLPFPEPAQLEPSRRANAATL